MKKKLNYYFSDKELIKILCKKRIKESKKGHDKHFLRNISSSAKSPHQNIKKEIFSFFPPRSLWVRLKKDEREKLSFNTSNINAIQLEKTIWREIKRCKKFDRPYPDWLENLFKYIDEIQHSVFEIDKKYQFSSPRVIPILKDAKENTYRPLAVYLPNDHLIIGQIAKYLTFCFDPLFSDSSYAFRTSNNSDKKFNHHIAVEDIIRFKNKLDCSLFVAECDISKFYDCVNHDIVFKLFKCLVLEAKQKLNIDIDPIALHFFDSYLISFAFNHNIIKQEKYILQKANIFKGTIPWVKDEDLLAVNSDPVNDRIGVPQGGAISCLIANILLNHVDKVVNSYSDENTFYGRFCDDMILINKDKENCELLLELYQIALLEVKLISHKPVSNIKYDQGFWSEKIKSKLPYLWGEYKKADSSTHSNVPWLAFVGYQIKFDGTVRVRKKSIANELQKQVKETDKIIHVVRTSEVPNVSRKAIKFRLQQRLISMSISRFRFGSVELLT